MAFLLRLLRLRYLIFGTAVGGGFAARKVIRINDFSHPFLIFLSLVEVQRHQRCLTRSLLDEGLYA